MAHCSNCGSPLTIADQPVKCPFCEAVNAPPPKEVMVAVPVQIVNNVIASSDTSAAMRRCPHCKKRLVTVVADGVSLSGCGACGGIWVDNASAQRVLSNPESIFADLARRCAAGASGSRGKVEKPTCAECPAILDRSSVHGIQLDTCSDHGTWFDARELETLVKMLRHEPVDVQPADTVECIYCHTSIAASRANLGPCCEGCWRNMQSAQAQRADAAMEMRGALFSDVILGLAGAMLGAAAGTSRR